MSPPLIKTTPYASYKGALIACAILAGWASVLVLALTRDWTGAWGYCAPVILLQTFLCTGLFINAHDAMHGVLAYEHPRVNASLGALSLILYALFSYEKLSIAHRAHHAHPASEEDPDYCDPEHPGFLAWYARFLWRYTSASQIVGMALLFNIGQHILHIPVENLLLFWVVPSLASTLQLFYFGTYLPHRPGDGEFEDAHSARSVSLPPWLSFLTCYHFGYHHEHHTTPDTPWWLLPRVRAARNAGNTGA